MNRTLFKRFWGDIQLHWDKSAGLVVDLVNVTGNKIARLTVGPLTNHALIAEKCLIWKGDKLVHDGKIDCPEVRKMLTSMRIVKAEFTSAARLQAEKGPRVHVYERCSTSSFTGHSKDASVKS